MRELLKIAAREAILTAIFASWWIQRAFDLENMCCDSPAMCEYIFAQKTFDVKVQPAGCGWLQSGSKYSRSIYLYIYDLSAKYCKIHIAVFDVKVQSACCGWQLQSGFLQYWCQLTTWTPQKNRFHTGPPKPNIRWWALLRNPITSPRAFEKNHLSGKIGTLSAAF